MMTARRVIIITVGWHKLGVNSMTSAEVAWRQHMQRSASVNQSAEINMKQVSVRAT